MNLKLKIIESLLKKDALRHNLKEVTDCNRSDFLRALIANALSSLGFSWTPRTNKRPLSEDLKVHSAAHASKR